MRKQMVRFVLIAVVGMLSLGLGAIAIAQDYDAECPMHHIQAHFTGHTRLTDGGTHQWAEYHCPGVITEDGSKPPHDFWIQVK